jgi:hypothetical protein
MAMAVTKWTLVQHSGYVSGGKPGFARAVEEGAIDRAGVEAKVAAAGGLVFDSYNEAAAAAETENYPPDVVGLYPRVRGSFGTIEVGGRRLYIPKQGGE